MKFIDTLIYLQSILKLFLSFNILRIAIKNNFDLQPFFFIYVITAFYFTLQR